MVKQPFTRREFLGTTAAAGAGLLLTSCSPDANPKTAGPKSALGQVKFEFDNAYGVYLHDTPARSAFDHDQREVSHGCVRLQQAVVRSGAVVRGGCQAGGGGHRVGVARRVAESGGTSGKTRGVSQRFARRRRE